MMTGDHPATARGSAGQVGLSERPEVITGPEMAALNETELLAALVPLHDSFARIVAAMRQGRRIFDKPRRGVHRARAWRAVAGRRQPAPFALGVGGHQCPQPLAVAHGAGGVAAARAGVWRPGAVRQIIGVAVVDGRVLKVRDGPAGETRPAGGPAGLRPDVGQAGSRACPPRRGGSVRYCTQRTDVAAVCPARALNPLRVCLREISSFIGRASWWFAGIV